MYFPFLCLIVKKYKSTCYAVRCFYDQLFFNKNHTTLSLHDSFSRLPPKWYITESLTPSLSLFTLLYDLPFLLHRILQCWDLTLWHFVCFPLLLIDAINTLRKNKERDNKNYFITFFFVVKLWKRVPLKPSSIFTQRKSGEFPHRNRT